MKNPYSGPVTQHHDYAITGEANKAEDFGTKPHNHRDRGNIMAGGKKVHRKAALSDGQRAHRGAPGGDFHRNPSWPTHGPFGE